MKRRAMKRRDLAWLIIGMVALSWPAAALAADLEPPPQRRSVPAGGGSLFEPDKSCLAWEDGCRTCQRAPDGQVACSNVGIACVPKAVRCNRR